MVNFSFFIADSVKFLQKSTESALKIDFIVLYYHNLHYPYRFP